MLPLLQTIYPISAQLHLLHTYSTNWLAITVFHTFQPISVLLQVFSLFMITSKQYNAGLIAHSSMELKYRY